MARHSSVYSSSSDSEVEHRRRSQHSKKAKKDRKSSNCCCWLLVFAILFALFCLINPYEYATNMGIWVGIYGPVEGPVDGNQPEQPGPGSDVKSKHSINSHHTTSSHQSSQIHTPGHTSSTSGSKGGEGESVIDAATGKNSIEPPKTETPTNKTDDKKKPPVNEQQASSLWRFPKFLMKHFKFVVVMLLLLGVSLGFTLYFHFGQVYDANNSHGIAVIIGVVAPLVLLIMWAIYAWRCYKGKVPEDWDISKTGSGSTEPDTANAEEVVSTEQEISTELEMS